MERVLEDEVMDSAEEARDYDAMDHSEVNDRFCTDLLAQGPLAGPVLDVGTGTALIPIAIARRAAATEIVAVDLAEHMLAVARTNVVRAGLEDRIRLQRVDAKGLPFETGSFATVVSNSIIHHIPEPTAVLAELARVTRSGGLVFVRDLVRPVDDVEVTRLVGLYAGTEPVEPQEQGRWAHQRDLLRDSLKAALTVEEITATATRAGMTGHVVTKTSDRHWTLVYEKP